MPDAHTEENNYLAHLFVAPCEPPGTVRIGPIRFKAEQGDQTWV